MKLNLGCGEFPLEGHVNVDIEPPCDVQGDFTTMTFEGVTDVEMSHVLEHLPWIVTVDALSLVRSWMVDGGQIRVEVPDMGMILARGVFDKDAEIAIYGIQSAPGEYHYAGFNAVKLSRVLNEVGFREVVTRCFASSHVARPGFPCLEARGVK